MAQPAPSSSHSPSTLPNLVLTSGLPSPSDKQITQIRPVTMTTVLQLRMGITKPLHSLSFLPSRGNGEMEGAELRRESSAWCVEV